LEGNVGGRISRKLIERRKEMVMSLGTSKKEDQIKSLEIEINNIKQDLISLKKELTDRRVIYNPVSWIYSHSNYFPISLAELKVQIEAIKEYLGIEYKIVPSKCKMESIEKNKIEKTKKEENKSKGEK